MTNQENQRLVFTDELFESEATGRGWVIMLAESEAVKI